MFNSPQMQKALQSPAVSGQNLAAYQSPASPNPTVRSDDAKAEELRRAQMAQRAMGMQAAAMMGDPKQTPSILAAKEMENQQLRQMLAALQQRQQPAPQQMARGLESLPAPAMERGYAGGGIVAFEDGGEVERYQSQGLVSPPGGFTPPVQRFFTGIRDLFSDFNKEGEPKLDEMRLAVLQEKIDKGTATPQEQTLYTQLKEKLATRATPAAPTPPRPPSVGDVAALGLDRGLPAAAAETRQRQQQSQNAGVAALRPAGQPVDASGIGMDFPSAERTPPSAGLLGEMQRMAAEGQEPSTTEPPVDSALARQKKILANRQALMKELGYEGSAGDEIRSQIEELKKSQEGYTKQAGLLGLAQALAAFGSAPRKQAAGAAAQAGAQFMTGQQEAKRKFETDMAALKASATRADRAEKRGDLEAVMKADADQEKFIQEAELQRQKFSFEERMNQARLLMQDKWQTMDDKTKRELSAASIRAQLAVANMPPAEFRTLKMLAESTGKPLLELMQMGKYGRQEVSAADRARLVTAYNDLPRAERAKYNDVEDFVSQMTGSVGGMPSGVTVKKKD